MSLQELSQYFKMLERLERDKEMLESLRAAASPGAQVLTGMPHTPGVKDKVGDLAIEIADLEAQMKYLRAQIAKEGQKVEEFVQGIENDQTRMVFRLRFLRCLTWAEVAAVIGGRNSEDGVKKVCYRYLQSLGVRTE